MTTNTPPLSTDANRKAFSVSPAAAQRISEILLEEKSPGGTALRISVDAGGCNGYQYRFALDSQRDEDDIIIQQDSINVVLDPVSLSLLEGAQLEWVDKLMGAHFAVTNPNAVSSCGCGSSFSVE